MKKVSIAHVSEDLDVHEIKTLNELGDLLDYVSRNVISKASEVESFAKQLRFSMQKLEALQHKLGNSSVSKMFENPNIAKISGLLSSFNEQLQDALEDVYYFDGMKDRIGQAIKDINKQTGKK